ncbi:unnamed protein product [Prorocentrum cordatum]|uniref:Uncharacterized protein n=1 Tax=Prorocentrum cordatum TaxID=2364126 RepID=A0ABN9TKS2_9DINO|nr:unnamed protein product [Polarella glacialis]
MPMLVVRNPATGDPCFDDEEDQQVRTDALCSIFEATELPMADDGGPQEITDAPDEDLIGQYDANDATQALVGAPNFKSAPVLKWTDPATSQAPRQDPEGAAAELWKLSTEIVGDPLLGVFQAAQAYRRAPQGFRDGETVSLRKPKGDGLSAKDHYRTINLIGHAGKAFTNVTIMPESRQMSRKLPIAQFGALQGRSTRDAIALVDEVGRRLFIAMYDMITTDIGDQTLAAGFKGVQVQYDPSFQVFRNSEDFAAIELSVLDTSQIKFVDDLITLTIVDDFDAVTSFLDFLRTQVNASGLTMNVCALHPTPTVKYLGCLLSATGSYSPEIKTRLTSANKAHGRLAQRVLKGNLSIRLKVRLWCSLVRSIALHALEVAFLTRADLKKSERWQTRKLRHILRPPAHMHRVSNSDIRKRANIFSVSSTLLHRRLQWRRHVISPGCNDRKGLENRRFAVHSIIANRVNIPWFDLSARRCPYCSQVFTRKDALIRKRDAGEAGVESTKPTADTEVAGISKKDRLMTKLLLQHADNFRGSARDQNAVVRLRAGSQMQVALESSTSHYQKAGKEARDTVAAADYRGHPLGKKPDAYLRMLLFRLSEAVGDRLEEVKAAVAQGANPQKSALALMTLVEFGKSLKDPEVKLKATRCFDARVTKTIDGKEVEEAKWIFAAMSHPAATSALHVLKANGGVKSASLILEDDEAPRSKTAKELEKMIFKGGGALGAILIAAVWLYPVWSVPIWEVCPDFPADIVKEDPGDAAEHAEPAEPGEHRALGENPGESAAGLRPRNAALGAEDPGQPLLVFGSLRRLVELQLVHPELLRALRRAFGRSEAGHRRGALEDFHDECSGGSPQPPLLSQDRWPRAALARALEGQLAGQRGADPQGLRRILRRLRQPGEFGNPSEPMDFSERPARCRTPANDYTVHLLHYIYNTLIMKFCLHLNNNTVLRKLSQ